LRFVVVARPLALFVQLDSQEISDVPEGTIADPPVELPVTIVNGYGGSGVDRFLDLQADARQRDIFEVRNPSACPAVLVFPGDVDEICT
jgi:hypothetical protein